MTNDTRPLLPGSRWSNRKLGKLPKREDPRTLKMARYVKPVPPAPKPPASADWITKVPSWDMYGNDQYGDCVIAAMAHIQNQAQFLTSGKFTDYNLTQILSMYSAIGGYVPSDGPGGPSDQGCDMLTALKYWKTSGFLGSKILAYMEVDPQNAMQVEQAIAQFGSLFIGVNLPAAVEQFLNWPAPPADLTGEWEPGSWGGHCVPPMDYTPGSQVCVSWGTKLPIADPFFTAYCDEAYVVLFPGWVAANGKSPSGLSLTQLQIDIAAL
jgi:hypothetical protein